MKYTIKLMHIPFTISFVMSKIYFFAETSNATLLIIIPLFIKVNIIVGIVSPILTAEIS